MSITFFAHLPGFDLNHGIITDDFTKYPYISLDNKVFERSRTKFNYATKYPVFERFTINENSFYVSEINLLEIFKGVRNELKVNNVQPITIECITELKSKFHTGYIDGLKNHNDELGPTYQSLSLENKKKLLVKFIDFSHYHLFFEGFATPTALYNLGYIQANLFLCYKNYQVLLELSDDEGFKKTEINIKNTINVTKNELNITVSNDKETNADRPEKDFEKIKLNRSINEIINLWMILLEIHNYEGLEISDQFKSKEEIMNILGAVFIDNLNNPPLILEAKHQYYNLIGKGFKKVIDLLMHTTFKANWGTDYTIESYSKILKATFSSYKGTKKLSDVSNNMVKCADEIKEAIYFLSKQGNPIAIDAYKFLEKVKK